MHKIDICGIHGNIKWSSLILFDILHISVTKVVGKLILDWTLHQKIEIDKLASSIFIPYK